MRRRLSAIIPVIILLFLLVSPVLASYSISIDVTESEGTSYTNLPVLVSLPIGYMAENAFIGANGTDVRVKDSQGNEVPFMLADDTLAFVANITGSSTNGFYLTTGNTPLDSFPVCAGYGGYAMTFDNANLELEDTFEVELDGWFDTSPDNPVPNYPYTSGLFSRISSTEQVATTTHEVTVPYCYGCEGSLWLLIFQTGHDANTHNVTPLSGWTSLINIGDNTTRNLYIAYRITDGSELYLSVNVTTSAACFSAHLGFRFEEDSFDGVPLFSGGLIETYTATPDPWSIEPAWGEAPIFCMAGLGGATNASITVSSNPTNYGNDEYIEASSTTYVHIGTADRYLATSSEDPGAFTLSGNTSARAFTIAIKGVEPTTYFVGKDNAFYIYPDEGTVNAVYYGPGCWIVSANMTTREHTVSVWATGTYFGIDVDGGTEDQTLQYATGVPDAASWWTINMPYFNYYEHSVGGVEDTFESYNNTADEDANKDSAGDQWLAQTFTPSVSHDLEGARLYMSSYGADPGTNWTLAVRTTDGSGHPTGSDLCSVEFDWGACNVSQSWHSFDFDSSYSVLASTKYALVLYELGDSDPLVQGLEWSYDGTSPTYSGGCMEISYNDDASWASYTSADFIFDESGSYYNLLLTYQPDAIIEDSVLPNEENPGTYDGLIIFGVNPVGISVDCSELEVEEPYYYEPESTSQDIIEPEPAEMTTDVNLDRLENNPLNPLVESIADVSDGQLTARLVWLGLAWFAFIAAMIFVFIKTHENIVFTTATGLGLSVMFYTLGIFNYAVIILLAIGFIAAIVHERMPTW